MMSKSFYYLLAVFALSAFFLSMNDGEEGKTAYHPDDIAVINNIIENNGLNCTKAEPADGSFVPADWIYVTWSDDETNRRIIGMDIGFFPKPTDLPATTNPWMELSGDLDLSALTRLQWLNCYYNNLTSLNVSGLTGLQALNCNINKLTSLTISGCANLQELHCAGNRLTSLYLSDCTGLQELRCETNNLTLLDIAALTDLQELHCGGNELTSLNVLTLNNLHTLDCRNNQLGSLDVSNLSELKSLTCTSNNLTSLNLSGCTNLETLYCYDNHLTSLGLSSATGMKWIICSFNNLNFLDVSKLTDLQELICDANQLTSLDVSHLTALKSLRCRSNRLSSLDLSGCVHLETLDCNYNCLAFIDLTGFDKNTYFEGSDQSCALTFTGSNDTYTAPIIFGDGVTFDNAALTYENGILTSVSDEALTFGFLSPTGLPDKALSGTIMATYKTDVNPANDPLARIYNSCALNAYMQNGRLHVSGLHTGITWRIYSLSGALIYQNTATGYETDIDLPARGVFIVKSGLQAVKVYY